MSRGHFRPKMFRVDDREEFTAGSLFQIDSAEKSLLCAVLKRAIEDFVMPERLMMNKLNRKAIIHIQKQAEFWLRNYFNKDVGSIRWLLENISNDPISAHKSVLKMMARPDLKEWLMDNCATHRVYPITRRKAIRDRRKMPTYKRSKSHSVVRAGSDEQ